MTPLIIFSLTWTLMALRAFLVVGAGGSNGFQSKTELLSDPNADSPSCVSAGCDVDTK